MFVIGLTGGIASGKSTAAGVIKKDGEILHIDADIIAKQIYLPQKKGYRLMISYFGHEFVSENGHIDTKKLGKLVFSDKDARLRLNSLLHPLIKEEIEGILKRAFQKIAVIDAPLLFEAGLDALCDTVWAVISDEEKRVSRIVKRDSLSEADARLRISSQKSDDFYKNNADVIIVNNGDKAELLKKVEELIYDAKKACK